MNKPFSVLMSVYRNDNPIDFRTAVESVSIKQTVQPSELIIVVDGPVPEVLSNTINELQNEISYIKVEWCKENRGLGLALQYGVTKCSNELIARMDSDDISVPYRFEKQLECFNNNLNLSIVGGTITEFIDTPDNIVGSRICPISDNDIKDYMRKRCALNHVTVMFKKSEVLKVGNYKEWFWNEDYYLWIRMLLNNCVFANLNDTLVNVRVGKEMYARRGGKKYFKSESGIQKFMYKNNLISLPLYLYNVSIRFILQVMMPNSLRGFIFRKFARN